MPEERYCSNCRALLPDGASVCPACGVFAGDVFDGKMPRPKRAGGGWLIVLIVLALAGGAFWYAMKTPPPVKHVPFVATVPKNERDAIGAVRRYLTSTGARNECLALIGKGSRDGSYVVGAVDHCAHKSLGQFLVTAKSGKVRKQ
jgi:hypothetical protein